MIRFPFARKAPRQAAVPPGRRIYAIGDVHGRLDLLDRLLTTIAEDQKGRAEIAPEIVLLGDLIDRGPDSAAVVRRAMNPPRWARFTTLMGNHEATMIEAIEGNRDAMRNWLAFGGRETLASWGVAAAILDDGTLEQVCAGAQAAVPIAERAWLTRLRQSLWIGDYFFVHAGIRPGIELERQSSKDMLWIRSDFLDSRRDHGAIIIHGHSIAEAVEELPNRIGIDTGAYASDRLTAIALEGTERWFLTT